MFVNGMDERFRSVGMARRGATTSALDTAFRLYGIGTGLLDDDRPGAPGHLRPVSLAGSQRDAMWGQLGTTSALLSPE